MKIVNVKGMVTQTAYTQAEVVTHMRSDGKMKVDIDDLFDLIDYCVVAGIALLLQPINIYTVFASIAV